MMKQRLLTTALSLGLLISSLVVFGQSDEESLSYGKKEYELENYANALKFFSNAIEANPNNAEAHKLKGNAEHALNKFRRAIDSYSKAIELDSTFHSAYFNRGLAMQQLDRERKAIADFDKAILLNPNYAKAYRKRGDSKSNLYDNSGANADYFKAREIELKNEKKISEGLNEFDAAVGNVENITPESDELEGHSTALKAKVKPVGSLEIKRVVEIDMRDFVPVQQEINLAGEQLLNARRTFVVGFLLNIGGAIMMASAPFIDNQKTSIGLGVAGAITTTVGGVVMLTAAIPIGGAGKILRKVRFPKTIRLNVD